MIKATSLLNVTDSGVSNPGKARNLFYNHLLRYKFDQTSLSSLPSRYFRDHDLIDLISCDGPYHDKR